MTALVVASFLLPLSLCLLFAVPPVAPFVQNRSYTLCFRYMDCLRASSSDDSSSFSTTRKLPSFLSNNNKPTMFSSSENNKEEEDDDILAWEREVMASTQARLDLKRVQKVLLDDDEDDDERLSSNRIAAKDNEALSFQISTAAATAAAAAMFVVTQNVIPSVLAMGGVFFIAQQDPNSEDNIAGAIARVLGRKTIQSVEASKPKVKALARAVVTGDDDILLLKQRIQRLENENEELKRWKRQKIAVDENMSRYTLQELKEISKDHQLPVTGTKTQLLGKLVEVGIIHS